MRLAFVVQRYGNEINGGAELHCRWIAERLSANHQVEVFTTCAYEYLLWKNHYPEGTEDVNGIPVHRFAVERQRDLDSFSEISHRVFHQQHSEEDELRWVEENGPYSPALVEAIRSEEGRFDFVIFFCYRYYTSFHGVQALGRKAILVPTAEEDEAVFLGVFARMFGLPRAIVHNSVEEQDLVRRVTGGQAAPGEVVGVGVEIPEDVGSTEDFRRRHDLDGPFLLYIGRIDWNKGCDQLFEYFISHSRIRHLFTRLVLIGTPVLQIPEHPDIIHLGGVDDREKYQALDACSMLVVPSRYESLCMVVLEAWGRNRPVLVNGRCPVLEGQVRRADGGLSYRSFEEFSHSLNLLLEQPGLGRSLGRQGNAYYLANYTWERVMGQYEQLLRDLS
jgi:glycosyltransferase involved in cell wall biosynthesis